METKELIKNINNLSHDISDINIRRNVLLMEIKSKLLKIFFINDCDYDDFMYRNDILIDSIDYGQSFNEDDFNIMVNEYKDYCKSLNRSDVNGNR